MSPHVPEGLLLVRARNSIVVPETEGYPEGPASPCVPVGPSDTSSDMSLVRERKMRERCIVGVCG